jgi:hypothetical protein
LESINGESRLSSRGIDVPPLVDKRGERRFVSFKSNLNETLLLVVVVDSDGLVG